MSSLLNKLVLGTAQWGLDYGINNPRGKIPEDELVNILNKALENKLYYLDTSPTYGNSEKYIGVFFKLKKIKPKIISKLPPCKFEQVERIFKKSLKTLGINCFEGYLIHNFSDFQKNNQLWNKLKEFKTKGYIKNIGFSIYYPADLAYLFQKKISFDLIQIPFNIFDQRFTQYLKILKRKKITVVARSVFLQGLLVTPPNRLKTYFFPIKNQLIKLNIVAKMYNIPLAALCLNFVLNQQHIDQVTIGIDNLNQLKEIIKAVSYSNKVAKINNKLLNLRQKNEKVILPVHWPIYR